MTDTGPLQAIDPCTPSPLQTGASIITLNSEQSSAVLTLRAGVPRPFTLCRDENLAISHLTFGLQGKPHVRQLNGSYTRAIVQDPHKPNARIFRLIASTVVDCISVGSGTVDRVTAVTAVTAGGATTLVGSSNKYLCGLTVDAISVEWEATPTELQIASVVIASATAPSQVLLTLADGTPLQSFPIVFDPAEQVDATSRDLTEAIAPAWTKKETATANPKATVLVNDENKLYADLVLLSQSDGTLEIDVAGTWNQTTGKLTPMDASAPPADELSLTVDPFHPATVRIPLGGNWTGMKVSVSLFVDANCTGGQRTRICPPWPADTMPTPRAFSVRATETVLAAQGFCLLQSPTLEDRRPQTLTAVWLCIPSLPDSPQMLDLAVAPADTNKQPHLQAKLTPAWQAQVPTDAAAYILAERFYWLRIPLPDPLRFEGDQIGSLFYLVASGHGKGTRLCHDTFSPANPIVDGEGRVLVGGALAVNQSVDSSWMPQRLGVPPTRWRMELELSGDPPAAPLLDAVLITVSGQQERVASVRPVDTVPSTLTFTNAVIQWSQLPVDHVDALKLEISSRATGVITLRTKVEAIPV